MDVRLSELIDSYNGCGMKAEYEGTRTFEDAASCHYWNRRGSCVMRGHQHMQRFSNQRLYGFAELLTQRQAALEACTNYEDLKHIVDETKKQNEYRGIGPVTRYDIATAIGYLQKPKVLPEKYVYLHAGVRRGYDALVALNLLPKCKGDIAPIEYFDFLSDLKDDRFKEYVPIGATYAMIVEDFLCVKHEELEKLAAK